MNTCCPADPAAPCASSSSSSGEAVSDATLVKAFMDELQARSVRLPYRVSKVCDAVCVQFELVEPAELAGSLREALAEGVRQREAGHSDTDTDSGAQAYGYFHRMLRITGLNAPAGVTSTLWLLLASGYADVQEVFEGYFTGENTHFRPRKGWPGRSAPAVG